MYATTVELSVLIEIEQSYVLEKKHWKRKTTAFNSKILICNSRSAGDQEP